ncbi:MAG: glutamate--cysteine ligase [Albidovulum sp.]|nr:glutamate--cysteine ligase [Albidovulum sp.]
MSIPQQTGGPIECRDQLAEFLESGCKPKKDWKIGTEHEKFGFASNTLKPLPYGGPCSIRSMLEGLRDEFGWTPVFESGNLIGLSKGSANVSLEPGGQLELSGAPLRSLHETCDEVNQHLVEVQTIASRIGAKFIGLGASPDWAHDQMPMMPKGRYKLMTRYMGKVGRLGTQMMYRTCAVQVNLDYESELDMVKKLRVGIALQPVATALFANSPFFDGRPVGFKSWRSRIWQDLDPDRTGMLPFVFNEGFGFEAWVDYALDVPMYFVYRDGRYIDALGQSFKDFLDGRLPALPGETPLLSDWADHLTTIFPEARIKTFIEMRGADGGPWRRLCALPAFWVGLLYDENSLDAAWDLVKGLDAESREGLRMAAAKDGLDGASGKICIRDLAVNSLGLAVAGLKGRGMEGANGLIPDETHFLDPMQEIVETGVTASDDLLRKFRGEWKGDLAKIYDEYSY